MTRRAHASPHALRVGCAGWALSSTVAARFPAEGSHLERYARVFSCVEINSSFYRPHQEKTYRRWAGSVPDAFRFSVKLPRAITHEARLRPEATLLPTFLAQVAGLRDKLGCLLVQLPPSLAFDTNEADDFFAHVRLGTHVPIACEPRHASWFTVDAEAVLRKRNVATVWAHPAPLADIEPTEEATLLYLRLHGAPKIYYSAYDDAFLDAVAARMSQAQAQGKDVWCIFDNTARGEAIPNALDLTKRWLDAKR